MSIFSERLVLKRSEAGYSQKELAEKLGISSARLSNWEKGTREPDVFFIQKIANILNTSGDYLIGSGFDENDQKHAPINIAPEALELARKYDAIGDEHARNVIRTVVNLEYEHHVQPTSLPTSEWLFAHAVNAQPEEDQRHSG